MNLKLEVETEQNNSAGKILAELTKVGLPQPKLPDPEPENSFVSVVRTYIHTSRIIMSADEILSTLIFHIIANRTSIQNPLILRK